MKKIVIKVLMLTVLLSVSVSSYAYDFEVDGIYYTSNPQLISSASFLRLNVLSSLN